MSAYVHVYMYMSSLHFFLFENTVYMSIKNRPVGLLGLGLLFVCLFVFFCLFVLFCFCLGFFFAFCFNFQLWLDWKIIWLKICGKKRIKLALTKQKKIIIIICAYKTYANKHGEWGEGECRDEWCLLISWFQVFTPLENWNLLWSLEGFKWALPRTSSDIWKHLILTRFCAVVVFLYDSYR